MRDKRHERGDGRMLEKKGYPQVQRTRRELGARHHAIKKGRVDKKEKGHGVVRVLPKRKRSRELARLHRAGRTRLKKGRERPKRKELRTLKAPPRGEPERGKNLQQTKNCLLFRKGATNCSN